jgi:hypothetical protein
VLPFGEAWCSDRECPERNIAHYHRRKKLVNTVMVTMMDPGGIPRAWGKGPSLDGALAKALEELEQTDREARLASTTSHGDQEGPRFGGGRCPRCCRR